MLYRGIWIIINEIRKAGIKKVICLVNGFDKKPPVWFWEMLFKTTIPIKHKKAADQIILKGNSEYEKLLFNIILR